MTEHDQSVTDNGTENSNTDNNTEKHIRKIRSFVKREGRMTKRQQTAIDDQWKSMGIDYQEQQLNFTDVFGNDNPVVLEIGFGMGKSLIEMAKNAPEKNFLGI